MRLQIFKEKEWTMEENNGIRLMKGYRKIDVEELFVEDVYWVGINLRSELYFILNFLVSEIQKYNCAYQKCEVESSSWSCIKQLLLF